MVDVNYDSEQKKAILKKRIRTGTKYALFIIVSLIMILPILTIVIAAFKTKEEYYSTGPFELPDSWLNFENFKTAFIDGKMVRGFINTTILLVISLTGAILTGTTTAYILNRFDFRGRKYILGAFLLATLVPAITTQIATFQIIHALGLFNTRGSAILLYVGTDIITIYIFIQFMGTIPKDIDESALIDGASYFRIYRTMILPLLKPAIATVLIIRGVGIYNDFYTPFLYMPSPDLDTISTALFRFQGPYGAQWQVIAAGIFIVIIPTLAFFVFLQKYIYNGIAAGASK